MSTEDLDHWGVFDRLINEHGRIDRIVVKFNESAIEEIRMGRFNHALLISDLSDGTADGKIHVEANKIHWIETQLEGNMRGLLGNNCEAQSVLFAVKHSDRKRAYIPIFDSLSVRDDFLSNWSSQGSKKQMQVSRHRTLDLLEDFLPDYDERAIMLNRRAISQFEERGDNVNEKHKVEHILVGGTGRLKKLASELEADGMNIFYQPSDENGRAEVIVIDNVPLDALIIHAREVELRTIAAEFGCHYHGWGSEILSKTRSNKIQRPKGLGWVFAKIFGVEELFYRDRH